MSIYEAERKAGRFRNAVDDDRDTIELKEHGVIVRVAVRSAELKRLEKDLEGGKIDLSREAFADRLADELSAALANYGDVATVVIDGPQELYDPMWDHLMKLAVLAEHIDERVIYSEISHGAVPECGCALTQVFTFPH